MTKPTHPLFKQLEQSGKVFKISDAPADIRDIFNNASDMPDFLRDGILDHLDALEKDHKQSVDNEAAKKPKISK